MSSEKYGKILTNFFWKWETFDGELSKRALKLIEKNEYLKDTFELFHDTVLWTIDVLGIFQAVETNTEQKHFG
jgi:hypothetical protein